MGGGQTYTMVDVGDGTGGGMFQMAGAPVAWIPYVAVDDVGKATAKAKSLGASILKDKTRSARHGLVLDLPGYDGRRHRRLGGEAEAKDRAETESTSEAEGESKEGEAESES